MKIIFHHIFHDCASQTSCNYSVFNSDDTFELSTCNMQDLRVNGFQKTHIKECSSVTFIVFFPFFQSAFRQIANRSYRENRDVLTFMNLSTFANNYWLKRFLPIGNHTTSSRIPDDKWT